MDDELQQLEAELARLRPTRPSVNLVRRLEDSLDDADEAPRGARPLWRWSALLPFGVAAAVVLAFTLRRDAPTPRPERAIATTEREVMKPVAVEKLLVAAADEGLVTLDDGTTARRARLQYVDTITWKNPHTNASMTWTVPREEVRVVPVRFQ